MLNKRNSGVLFHISSMPSDYAVGVFDENCYHFIDKISDAGFSYWQVLPFNPLDHANSPYCSPSAFAGNYLFIDPKSLLKEGLCTEEDFKRNIYDGSPYTADYDFASSRRLELLKKCYKNCDEKLKSEIENFKSTSKWLYSYSLFMAIKNRENGSAWWEWSEKYSHFKNISGSDIKELETDIDFWCFVQYIFFEQWKKIKQYANKKGVAIIGDIPIYVAMDSADVWSNINLFKIDKTTLKPTKIAGVPPDYFSENGQLWGNPIYDWSEMKKDNYKWWMSRLENSLEMYDVVRIDHFRAFASYWEVDADSKTAKNGEWKKGPEMSLFNEVFKKFKNPPIIAEDLGTFGEDVVKLLEETKIPGIKVVQFGFDPNSDSLHLPHNCTQNSVNYIGTHDNNTLLGWLWEASESERNFALKYCGFEGENWGDGGFKSKSCRKIIESVWASSSNTAIIAFQDMCGFGSDARMNIPGVPEKNWRFRTTRETIDSVDFDYFKNINSIYRRTYPVFD